MKANELRVGNLYDQFDNVHEVSWSTIKDLIDAPETQIWCKPIPLTEEWLLKFMFKKDKIHWNDGTVSDDCYVSPDWKFIIHISQDGIGFFQLIRLETSVLLTFVEYVHQLQNVYFALTNEELELKES